MHTQNITVQHIKQQSAQFAQTLAVPAFWLTDWLLYVLNQPSLFLITDADYPLSQAELEQFYAGVSEMRQGTPLAYLTGHQEFWSLDFKVNRHTLIPRPDTEVLVEEVLSWISQHSFANQAKRLLDLGTGSGCIAISLAHELSLSANNDSANWHVIAVDVSAEALKVAQHNAAMNKVQNIECLQSSWYESLNTDDAYKYEVIVSNPPYIDEADEHLVRLHAEPISALSSPNQGLADIEHIVTHAPRYLHLGGLLAIEHGYNQGLAVRQFFIEHGFESIQTVQDLGGRDRVTLGQRPK